MTNISQHKAHLSPQEKRALLAQLLREKAGEVTEVFPLSYGQQALMFIYQSAPESAAYHVAFTARIRSDVDVPALRRAFQALINRHPALRTTFSTQDGEPVQAVHGFQEVCFEQTDASTWSWDELKMRVVEAYQRPFDLQGGPVLRVSLFTRSAQDHLLLLTIHHIACDGWSLWLLLDELRALYPAEAAGKKASLPSLKLSYADYVRWQTEMLAGKEGERLWAYWQKQLAGELPSLHLPTDRQRPPVQTYQGASHPFKLPEELTRRLKELAQEEGATLYMTLLAAFFVLLHRYTGSEDILVGSPTAGRGRQQFEGMVGFFVNMVVLRADLSENSTFKAFLCQVRHTVLGALEHQDYPFPLLVERLQPIRDASRSPLFQAAFILLKSHRRKQERTPLFIIAETEGGMNLGGLELEPFPLERRAVPLDLTLMMEDAGESLHASLQYNTDLFDAATMARMAGHFQTLLKGIVADPGACIAALPILTEAERHQLLVEWNDTQADYPQDRCLHQLFEAQVEQTPDAVAVMFEDQQLTYRQLNAKANQLAHHLKALGVGPDVLVGICVERSIKMIVGLLGILKAGGAYVPLDPAYPQERLAFMLEDSQVQVLLTQQRLVEGLPEHGARVVCLDSDETIIVQESDENPQSGVTADNLAYVMYTSGSTGRPKGVMVSHKSVVHLFAACRPRFHFDPRDVWTLFHSYSFDFSVWEIWGALLHGSRLVIVPDRARESPAAFGELLRSEGVTVLNLTPSAFRLMLAEGHFPDFIPERIVLGGEALPPELATQLLEAGVSFWNFYGPTEATVWSSFHEMESKDEVISIGRPIANTQLYILDSHLLPVPIGVSGELHIGGVGLARGYLNRPELTAEKFIKNPFRNEPGAQLYKTGDLARYLPDGKIECLGRIDHLVKIRGFRIEPGEIEATLAQHPSVQQTVVLAREEKPGDKRLVAYVVPNEGQVLTPSDLRHFITKKLPDYMVPAAFVILEKMPLTASGKVDRRALPVRETSQSGLQTEYVAPRTPTEEVLARIWTEVLGLERAGIYNNFFELGGHSLLATRVMTRIREAFQVELPLHSLFEAPTVADLAERIETVRWAAQDLQASESATVDDHEEIEL